MRPIHLRTVREKKRLTQEQLAAASGVTQVTISRLENDPDTRPAFDTVVNLANALNVDPKALRFGPDPNTQERAAS